MRILRISLKPANYGNYVDCGIILCDTDKSIDTVIKNDFEFLLNSMESNINNCSIQEVTLKSLSMPSAKLFDCNEFRVTFFHAKNDYELCHRVNIDVNEKFDYVVVGSPVDIEVTINGSYDSRFILPAKGNHVILDHGVKKNEFI